MAPEILGGKTPSEPTKLVGAKEPGQPNVLDSRSKTEQPAIVTRVHEETEIQGQSRIRRPKQEPSDADVRFRQADDPKAWEKVKRLEDE